MDTILLQLFSAFLGSFGFSWCFMFALVGFLWRG